MPDLQIETSYRSDRNQVLHNFHIPCLEQSTSYDRAAGYFTSASLSLAATGLSRLIQRDGRMRLVASPCLNEEDGEAIREGYEQRAIIERNLVRELTRDDIPDPVKERLGFLAWMVAEGFLDIRIALVRNDQGVGIYHEKFGMYTDSEGHQVVFSGSANETRAGLVSNFESLEVFRSWVDIDTERVKSRVYDFDMLWEGNTDGLQIYDFPEAAKRSLLEYKPRQKPLFEPEELDQTLVFESIPRLPAGFSLRHYQKEAIEKWFSSNGRGLWEMATGTGKTITALITMIELWKHIKPNPMCVIIVCPFKDLVKQWDQEVRELKLKPILCYESREDWLSKLGNALVAIDSGDLPVVAIATNNTFAGKAFQEVLRGVKVPILFIADEVHNLGANFLQNLLPDKAQYRLGLSATPIRHRDQEGTEKILQYFGNVIYKFTLKQGIDAGCLTPYNYYPIVTYLHEEELSEYIEITREIGKIMGANNTEYSVDTMADGPLKTYLLKRARILGKARAKLERLKMLLSELRDSTHNLVYCSDASVPGEDGSNPQRHIDSVTRVIGRDLKMRVKSYTHLTPSEERGTLRQMLATGDIQVLTAIRCLDEGVDIPEARRGFLLASSTNPRQFIQRRGRLLRLSEGKEESDLFDFLVIPPREEMDDSVFGIERKLVRREMERIIYFAKDAQNGDLALSDLLNIRIQYNLLDVGI